MQSSLWGSLLALDKEAWAGSVSKDCSVLTPHRAALSLSWPQKSAPAEPSPDLGKERAGWCQSTEGGGRERAVPLGHMASVSECLFYSAGPLGF